jgi:hypothetical protein
MRPPPHAHGQQPGVAAAHADRWLKLDRRATGVERPAAPRTPMARVKRIARQSVCPRAGRELARHCRPVPQQEQAAMCWGGRGRVQPTMGAALGHSVIERIASIVHRTAGLPLGAPPSNPKSPGLGAVGGVQKEEGSQGGCNPRHHHYHYRGRYGAPCGSRAQAAHCRQPETGRSPRRHVVRE